ncbi:MAG: beta-hexosaminidase, partial [Methylocystis silviterrae]
MRAFICGLKGFALEADERAFLRDAAPWGVILFRRNVDAPEQIRRLTAEIRDALGRHA